MARTGIAFIISIFTSMISIAVAVSLLHKFGIARTVTNLDHPYISGSILILAIAFTPVINKVLKNFPKKWNSFLNRKPYKAWKLLQATSILLYLSAFIVFGFGTYGAFIYDFRGGIAFAYGIATLLWGLGRRFGRVRRRLEAPKLTINESNSNSSYVSDGPSILLLRSFNDDNFDYMNRQPFYREYFSLSGNNLAPLVEGVTFEESIYNVLSMHGNVIAIGRPGDELTPLGAPRFYVPDNDNWEDYASDFMNGCTVVAIILGRSDGFCWEIDQLLKDELLTKVLLFVPPVTNKEKRYRWKIFNERIKLSGLTAKCEMIDITNVLLLTFGPDLSCYPIYGKTKSTTEYSEPIENALKSVL
jgi:hypothetical protein